MLAIAIVTIPAYARGAIQRISVREMEFVEASRSFGATNNILFRRIMPNALAPLIVTATLASCTAIIDAAALFSGPGCAAAGS